MTLSFILHQRFCRILTALALTIGLNINLSAQQSHINFEKGTWAEIKAKAAAEHKLIFVDAYTTWCGPCKWMAANVFTDSATADFFNSHFINAQIDMEKGEGLKIAEEYGVKNYPTFLYVDGQGTLMHRTCGSTPADVFTGFAKVALNPDERLAHYRQVFESGKYDTAFIPQYLNMLTNGCSGDVNNVALAWLAKKTDAELVTKESWLMIQKYVTDIYSREFKVVLKNRDAFAALDKPEAVDAKLFNAYATVAGNIIRSPKTDLNEYHAFRNYMLTESGYERAQEVVFNYDMGWFRKQGDWNNYATTAVAFMEKYPDHAKDAVTLNKLAWSFFENITDPAMLQKALDWAQKSVELKDASFNNDTYANLLFKVGRKDEAIKVEEKALELVKKEPNGDVASIQETLNKFRSPN